MGGGRGGGDGRGVLRIGFAALGLTTLYDFYDAGSYLVMRFQCETAWEFHRDSAIVSTEYQRRDAIELPKFHSFFAQSLPPIPQSHRDVVTIHYSDSRDNYLGHAGDSEGRRVEVGRERRRR